MGGPPSVNVLGFALNDENVGVVWVGASGGVHFELFGVTEDALEHLREKMKLDFFQ